MRLSPIGVTGSLLDFSTSDDYTTTAGGTSAYTGVAPGTRIFAAPTDGINTGSNVPNWIGSELMYVLNTSASTFIPGTLVTIDKDCAIAALASTANMGRSVYVTLTSFAAGNVTPQGGWVMVSGIAPVKFSATATAGAVYIGSAGNATPTPAAGKQILGAVTLIAAASAFTRTVVTKALSNQLQVGTSAGMFPGQAITATGTSGLTVSSVNADGTSITMSGNATATGTVTGTFTPTGYGIVHFQSASTQSQIT